MVNLTFEDDSVRADGGKQKKVSQRSLTSSIEWCVCERRQKETLITIQIMDLGNDEKSG